MLIYIGDRTSGTYLNTYVHQPLIRLCFDKVEYLRKDSALLIYLNITVNGAVYSSFLLKDI